MRNTVDEMLNGWILVVATVAIGINGLWFGAAFRLFSLRSTGATRVLFVGGSNRESPLVDSLAALLRFLGGMNAALALLCSFVVALVLVGSSLFGEAEEIAVILLVLGVANLTQFWFNVPVHRAHEADPATLWPVTTGLMRQIFVGDLTLTTVDLGIAALVVSQA